MSRRGFTLIELLVVISIIGLLSSIVFASLNSARDKGRLAAGKQFDAATKHGIGDQLVGEWLFDVAGNTNADTSSNGNNASCTTCPTVVSGYNSKNAYAFDTATLSIPDNQSLDISDGLTISFWFYAKAEFAGYALHPINKWTDTTDANFVLYYFGQASTQNREIQFFTTTAGSVWTPMSRPFQVQLNTWYHVLFSHTASKGGQLYIDSKPIGSRFTASALSVNNRPINFESGPWIIDDLRIYSTSI